MTRSKCIVSLLLAVAIAACGSSNDGGSPDAASADARAAADAAPPDAEPQLLSNIDVTVSYDGQLAGDLVIGAFLSSPPMGPPLAFQSLTAPTFPVSSTLLNLEPNTYYVIAILDVPPASPTAPGPEDIQAVSDAIATDGIADMTVSMTITEPTK